MPLPTALVPLSHPVFRMLWTAWLIANTCMWMNDVAAAWLMTTLSDSPVMVALVQTASTLPMFLFGLPSGAMADIVDRRRFLLATQFWIAGTGALLAAAVASGIIDAPLLLVLTLLNGVGLAMRWPVYSAIVPELVERARLPAALALNGVAMNASRIIGPVIAGLVITSAGTAAVFALNAVLASVSAVLVFRWRRTPRDAALPGERFLGAMRVGIQHVAHSPRMRTVLLRIAIFFAHSGALLALLPLVARQMPGGGARTFTLLIAAMGVGAVLSVFLIPRWRKSLPHDTMIRRGSIVQAAMMVVVACAPSPWVAVPGLVINGIAWLTVANTLSVCAQLTLPNWVRARGMSMYQMALMGSSAAGAAFWGQVATFTDVRTSLIAASVSAVGVLGITRRWRIGSVGPEDQAGARPMPPPASDPPLDPRAGPVVVNIEYRIDPARLAEFDAVMRETRRRRLSQGALSWTLLRDTADPGRYVEQVIDATWLDHLRRFERLTTVDDELRARRHALHTGEAPPRIERHVAQTRVMA